MDPDNNVLKWTAAATGVIIVCFCIGYFVLGPTARTGSVGTGDGSVQIAETTADARIATPSAAPGNGGLIIQERTDELEAKRKKAEEAAKKKAEEEAKKKAEAEAKRKKEEQAAAEAAAKLATPTPSPEATATPDPASDPSAGGDTPEATPTPAAAEIPTGTLIHVRVGSFSTRDAARALQSELNGRGYQAIIVAKDGSFSLQIGSYRDRKNAEKTQKELAANGYDATVE